MNESSDRIDYMESSDITEVHAAIRREHRDPGAEVTPIPTWLTGVCGVAILWAGMYIGVFHGGFSPNVFDENQSSPLALFPPPKKAVAQEGGAGEQSLAAAGKSVYAQCQACHQANGQGVPGQFPPLAGSEWVVQGERRLLAIILKGAQGPMTVGGKSFNGAMPAWETALTSKKIAQVASYIRAEWGNGAPEVTVEAVEAAKKEFAGQTAPFTEAQLLEIPADASYEGGGAPAGGAPVAAAAQPPAPAPAPAASEQAVTTLPPANTPPAATADAAPAAADPAQLEQGKQVYMTTCVACHQPTGAGLPAVFPPITNSPYISGSPERLAAIILKGNAGPFTVDGKQFNNIMTPLEATLTDDKIAAVMTYVRANFGNKGGPVTAQFVEEVRKKFADRKTPWTQAELDAWKE